LRQRLMRRRIVIDHQDLLGRGHRLQMALV
jgi:hypothetical protein